MLRENVDRNFGFIIHDVARLLRTEFDRRVKSMGLTRSQWWVLVHLFRCNGATQSELADELEIEKASLGRLLDRLETNGWVRRVPCEVDRRAKRVYLTEEVSPAVKDMRDRAADLRRDALAGLPREEREKFVDALLQIKSNLTNLQSGTAGAQDRQALTEITK